MMNIRRLPIVGDVHLGREQWPEKPEDWASLWSTSPLPVRVSSIAYSVNEECKAFSSLGLRFSN